MNAPVRVLVVDDEIGIREGCRRVLGPRGFEVDVAENGPVGLRKLRESRYDVLLLDIIMPGMSGMEVLHQARQIDPELICIVITGYATVELAVQAIREGAHDFIAKPFSADHLLQVINRELERRALRKEAEKLKALEEEARELARTKAELQKLEAVESRFMVSLVHILRAPVAVIQNTLQLIRKGYIPPEEIPETLERLEIRAGELLETLDDLLLLAHLKERIGLSQTEITSLAEVLNEVLVSLKPNADRQRLTMKVDVQDSPKVRANPAHIRALWKHLIDNAIRYTPSGGHITISLWADKERGLAIGAVSDTGIGIPADEIPRIFEEFYRAQEAKRMRETGTGLGLPIVRQVLELYGGTIEVESEVSRGSTFRFMLPLVEDQDEIKLA
ncbi:MAG: hybrid sensor histidine kinase/response regulator [Anaerolineae bacterium]|nr:hybrid sensor histidine kinase/response regulator [Anaerolineae bacterium]MDW8101566.1 hybrid sensor histidine kinase/response regulator [Anaerolineae bacterium]